MNNNPRMTESRRSLLESIYGETEERLANEGNRQRRANRSSNRSSASNTANSGKPTAKFGRDNTIYVGGVAVGEYSKVGRNKYVARIKNPGNSYEPSWYHDMSDSKENVLKKALSYATTYSDSLDKLRAEPYKHQSDFDRMAQRVKDRTASTASKGASNG